MCFSKLAVIFCASNVLLCVCVFVATEKVHAMEKESEIQSANEVKVRNVYARIQMGLFSLDVYFYFNVSVSVCLGGG